MGLSCRRTWQQRPHEDKGFNFRLSFPTNGQKNSVKRFGTSQFSHFVYFIENMQFNDSLHIFLTISIATQYLLQYNVINNPDEGFGPELTFVPF